MLGQGGFAVGVGMAACQPYVAIWQTKMTLAVSSSPSRCLSERGPIPSGIARDIPHSDMDKQGKCASQNLVPELNERTRPVVV